MKQGFFANNTIRICILICISFTLTSCDREKSAAKSRLKDADLTVSIESFDQALQLKRPDLIEDLLTSEINFRQNSQFDPLRKALQNKEPELALKLLDYPVQIKNGKPSLLSLAIDCENPELITRLVNEGQNPNDTFPDGNPLLSKCLEQKKYSLATLLLDLGAHPKTRDLTRTSSLQLTVADKQMSLSERLIHDGADVNYQTPSQLSPLSIACLNRDTAHMSLLLRSGAKPNAKDGHGNSLLSYATKNAHWNEAQLLLQAGANPNSYDDSGQTPLHWTIHHHNRNFIQTLLIKGANPSLPDHSAFSPLHQALAKRDFPLADLLISAGSDPSPFLTTALNNKDKTCINFLLSYGVNSSSPSFPHKYSPLTLAILQNDTELAERFLQRGAEVTRVKWHNQSLLAITVAQGNSRIANQLLRRGANPNTRIPRPVHKAYRSLPLAKKMSWFLRKDTRISLLMMACHDGDLELAKTLLDGGAKRIAKTGRTSFWPINFASRRADVRMMRLMLGRDPYYEAKKIIVNLSKQRLYVYNQSRKIIFTSKISTGKKGNDTPTGEFAITNKYEDWTSTLYDSEMPYFQRLSCGDFGFHEGYVPNYPASHGCIRIPKAKAEKFFAITDLGDRVIIQP